MCQSFNVKGMSIISVKCDALPGVADGAYTAADCTTRAHDPTDTCTLECNTGFMPDGEPVTSCQSNGTWSSHAICVGE
jgi:hypothetical protein